MTLRDHLMQAVAEFPEESDNLVQLICDTTVLAIERPHIIEGLIIDILREELHRHRNRQETEKNK